MDRPAGPAKEPATTELGATTEFGSARKVPATTGETPASDEFVSARKVPPTAGQAPDTDEFVSNRIATIPNLMTLARLACVPVFLWLLFGKGDRASAAWLLGALGATDFADGYVARHLGQVSELGKLLDPTADRVLLIVGIGSIIVDGDAPRWFALIVLLREGIVALVTLVLFLIVKRRPSDVQWVGKAGTFGLMWAFPLFLMGESTVSWHRAAHWLGWVAGIPALVLSLYAAVAYVPLWRAALVEHRQSRAGVSVLTGGVDR